uniref:Uncharacterized protein n=1 Tax=Anguilla anguilla TaxID=7936 RepID=A0A0E9XE92_ANGAN
MPYKFVYLALGTFIHLICFAHVLENSLYARRSVWLNDDTHVVIL